MGKNKIKRKIDVAVQTDLSEMLSASSSSTTSRSSSETDLLAAWKDLLGWSENAAVARKLQEEMIILKHELNRLGNKSSFELLDTEPSIQIAIEALKNEKTQLTSYRSNMLRLNASVHSWLTRQERKLQSALVEQQLREATVAANDELLSYENQQQRSQQQLQKQYKSNSSILMEEEQDDHKVISTDAKQSEDVESAAATRTIAGNDLNAGAVDSNGNPLVELAAISSGNLATGSTNATNSMTTSTHSSVGTSTGNVTVASAAVDKIWDVNTLLNSEQEFHKHLKDEVSDMYSAWDEADARINTQLDLLTTSLNAWRQLECGLFEFQQALGQDRGTLKGLEGALNKGEATPVELAQNVKLVAKLLSEKVNVSQEQLTAVQEHLDPNHILHIAKFTASNGSLSDSGISDGGTTSDGGLSERERRLGILRRLAKQLESALAPGSEAMKSIAARMESAEAELKNLQNTCRDLIVRTAATHQNMKQQQALASAAAAAAAAAIAAGELHRKSKANGKNAEHAKANGFLRPTGIAGGQKNANQDVADLQRQQNGGDSPSKRKNKRKQRKQQQSTSSGAGGGGGQQEDDEASASTSLNSQRAGASLTASGGAVRLSAAGAPDSGDPSDDPIVEFDLSEDDDEDNANGGRRKKGWVSRIARAALPMQLAIMALLWATMAMQPNCCDNINNLAMSFTPQLRYIRGPPPI